MRKTILQEQYSSSVRKTARKNTKYSRNGRIFKIGYLAKAKAKSSRNKTILKIGHHSKPIAHACYSPWSVWVKNWKCWKHAKNYSTRTVELFCAKSGSKKHQIFEKWDNFENRPPCKGYSLCMGYNLCKMVSLGQKLKMPKRYEKRFYKSVTFVLCKKSLQKTENIWEMRQFWKSAILQRL